MDHKHLNRKERKKMDLEKLSKFDKDVHLIKCVDIIDNVSSICNYDKSFAKTYLVECDDKLNVMRQNILLDATRDAIIQGHLQLKEEK